MKYFDWIDKLEKTQGTNNKLAVLKEGLEKDEMFKFYVKTCYDPFLNTWSKTIKTPIICGTGSAEELVFPTLYSVISGFRSRSDDNIGKVLETLGKSSVKELPYLLRWLQKDMRCGIAESLINKACPNLIPIFEVALANPWNEKKLVFPCILNCKLDGLRILAIKNKDTVNFYTRNGKAFEADQVFTDELLELAGDADVVFDGEMMGVDFDQTMTQARRKHNKDQSKLKYTIFDMVPLYEWKCLNEVGGASFTSLSLYSKRLRALKLMYSAATMLNPFRI
jgi:DNA ligase-1